MSPFKMIILEYTNSLHIVEELSTALCIGLSSSWLIVASCGLSFIDLKANFPGSGKPISQVGRN